MTMSTESNITRLQRWATQDSSTPTDYRKAPDVGRWDDGIQALVAANVGNDVISQIAKNYSGPAYADIVAAVIAEMEG
jgi:hypothetical protein